MKGPQALPLTFARLALGFICTVHGLSNVFGLFGGPGIEEFAKQVEGKVAIAPALTSNVVAYGELLMGILLLLGSWTRLAAAFCLGLVVAATLVGARYTEFFVKNNGIEYMLALAALSTVTLTLGPGAFCVDLGKVMQRFKGKGKDKAQAKGKA